MREGVLDGAALTRESPLDDTGGQAVGVGVPVRLDFSTTDPGNDRVLEWRIDWADGSPLQVIAAADLLRNDWGVESDLWSAPSFNELRRDGIDCERWNLLHPMDEPRVPHVAKCVMSKAGPVVAATDYMRIYADSVRPYIKKTYKVLGTDGFGRSDSRENLRRFFEVNRFYVTVAALTALAEDGVIERKVVADAIKKYGIDPNKPNPTTV